MSPLTPLPVIAYLAGSLPVSLWVGRRWSGRDLRTVGSGNPGATNVLRVAGRGPALLAFAGDAIKGAVVVVAGQLLAAPEWVLAASVLTAVLGHMYSPWLGFRGGKGVATAFGGFLALAPFATGCAVAVFVALVFRYRYVSLGSMVAVLCFPLIWLVLARLMDEPAPDSVSLAVAVAIGLLVVWRHGENIRRLRGGCEARLGGVSPEPSSEARS